MFTIDKDSCKKIVRKDGAEFLTVNVKGWWRDTLRFYQRDKLVFESYLNAPFFHPRVTINYQDLPQKVNLRKNSSRFYAMYYGNNVLSIDMRYFRNQPYILNKNGFEIATVGGPRLETLSGGTYEMKSATDKDEENTLLLILFLAQLIRF